MILQDTPEMPIVRAERLRLRKTLATNLSIQWGKRVNRIVHDEKGVEAFFEDGTSANGDVLVGADGINSSGGTSPAVVKLNGLLTESLVRTHLLKRPGSELLKIVPLAAIVGEVELEGDAFKRQLELGHSAYIYQSPDLGFMNFCGLHHTLPNGISGRHYWMFMEPDADIAKKDHWLQTATQHQKLDHVLKAAAKMPPRFRELFELTPATGIKKEPHLWKVLEMDVEVGTLPAERVVLLGDAVHPMTPFRGEGGYHTLVDAMLLSRTLAKVQNKGFKEMMAALAEYNAEMVERGSDAVRTSRSVQATQKTREGQSKYVSARQEAKPMPWETIQLTELKA